MTLKIGNLGPQLTHHDFISVYLLCLCNYREHNTKTTLCLICALTLPSVITQTHFTINTNIYYKYNKYKYLLKLSPNIEHLCCFQRLTFRGNMH